MVNINNIESNVDIGRGYNINIDSLGNIILKKGRSRRNIGKYIYETLIWEIDRGDNHIVRYDNSIGLNYYMVHHLPDITIVKMGNKNTTIEEIKRVGKENRLLDIRYEQQRFVPLDTFK